MKLINYFSMEVTVPAYAKCIATDPDGQMWYFSNRPKTWGSRWVILSGVCAMCGVNPNVKNWRRSLREC